MAVWQGAEEFERKVPLSEAVRQKRVQDFLDGISAQIAARKQNAVPNQLNIAGINPTLESLRSKEPSPNLSIDQMKALGLHVPEYPSSPYSVGGRVQRRLPILFGQERLDFANKLNNKAAKGTLSVADELAYLQSESVAAGLPIRKLIGSSDIDGYLRKMNLRDDEGLLGNINRMYAHERPIVLSPSGALVSQPSDIPSGIDLHEKLKSTRIPFTQQAALPGTASRRRVAGRFPVELLLAAIASGAGGVVAADAINQPNQELVEVM